ncbi:hypothetical protein ACWN8V_07150 [Vagococcus elongatus]|uniref:Uncharacterized protein n=1 Tax=Vagococcus elongatus TaxID=180344 RepID=A0A430AW79_9ENTE|nr:hypothetical protein [Vagococcus elongatus]RSU12309.1 hypothetical protein CBF29_06825 [Vagococcus elongatus]
MHYFDMNKFYKIRSFSFWMYIVLIAAASIFSLYEIFKGSGVPILPTIVSAFIFVYSSSRREIVENYLYDISKIKYRRVDACATTILFLSNVPLVLSMYSIFRKVFISRTQGGFKYDAIAIVASIIIVTLLSLLKWILKFVTSSIGLKRMSMRKYSDNLEDNGSCIDENDEVIKSFKTNNGMTRLSDDYFDYLSNDGNPDEYKGIKSVLNEYTIELRSTRNGQRYYVILDTNDGTHPGAFVKIMFDALYDGNKDLNKSIPMFREDTWPMLDQGSDKKLHESLVESFIGEVKSYFRSWLAK